MAFRSKSIWSLSIPITIKGKEYEHKFIVAEQLTAEALLGLYFMEANKCVLDLVSGKIKINSQTVSLIPDQSKCNTWCVKITSMRKITIPHTGPCRSEMEIMAYINSKEKGTRLLEGAQFKELHVCVARTLTMPQNQVVPIRVVNLDPLPVTLHKSTKLVNAELIRDNATCAVNQQHTQGDSTPVAEYRIHYLMT